MDDATTTRRPGRPKKVIAMGDGIDIPEPADPMEPALRQFKATVDIPLQTAPEGALLPRHIEAGGLSSDQAHGMRLLRRGLAAVGAKLNNGKEVMSNVSAVRWVLERIAETAARVFVKSD